VGITSPPPTDPDTGPSAPAESANPLADGLERQPVQPTSLVVFGATGDLGRRKLLPAVYNLAHEGSLPGHFELHGVARADMSEDRFRDVAARSIRRHSRRPPESAVLERLLGRLHYLPGEFDDDLT
jgi:glucose-6-phosphate 1-dehydrogenase